MKIKLCSDERYPFWDFAQTIGTDVDVPAKTVKRWRRVMKQFEEVQNEMEQAESQADRFPPSTPL